MTTKRGLVISNPIEIVGQKLSAKGIDLQELRFALLFWDQLDFPANSFIRMPGGPDVDFLEAAGILKRTDVRVVGSGDLAQMYLAAHLHAFRSLDRKQPGMWSLGSGINSVSFPDQELEDKRGILVRLHQAVPVPDKEVPLNEILEFKAKHQDELAAFRYHLDGIYQRILAAGDGELALFAEVASLERSISDYIKAAKRFSLPFVNVSFDANLNVWSGLIAGGFTYKAGFDIVSSLLAGATASALSIGPTFSLKGRGANATPFRYVSSFHKRVF